VLVALGLCVVTALLEHVLEVRDATRLTAGDTFYPVQRKKVRYRLTGADKPGPTVVLINGMMASLEQWDDIQTALSTDAPVVTYDRGGMGFSDGSDAHDARAQADELAGLLHAPNLSPPFVVVSFSSGSLVARVFAAEHPDLTAGLVFLDPMVPEAVESMPADRRVTYMRKYVRLVLRGVVESFFGYLRLQRLVGRRHDAAPSLLSERTDAVLWSFHHWLATTGDILDLQRSSEEAMATPWFGATPLGVLSATDPAENELSRRVFAGQEELATKSTHGVFRAGGHFDHGKILNDPTLSRAIVDLIRAIVAETHATKGAAASP
jgi:pimeloyl-ACP methyl ester carboxylesterase